MPKIKTADYDVSVPSSPTPGVAAIGIEDRGVPKASPQRVFEGEGIGAVTRPLTQIQESLRSIGATYARNKEMLRKSNSQLQAEEMERIFLEKTSKMTQLKGENTANLLDDFKEEYDDLKEALIPEDVDEKTRQELTLTFERNYNTHAKAIIGHQASQINTAEANIRSRNIANSHIKINYLPNGDIIAVKQLSNDSANIEFERHPEYTEAQRNSIRAAYEEDYMAYAYTKWFIDNPTFAKHSWENNQEVLKKMLGSQYTELQKQYEKAKDQSNYDVLSGTLVQKYGNDNASIIEDISKNWQKYIDSGVDARHLEHMQSFYQGKYNHEITKQLKIKQDLSNETMTNFRKQFTDEDGKFNNTGYMQALEKALYAGKIDIGTFNIAKNTALHGEFSTAGHNDLIRKIHKGDITETSQIDALVLGTSGRAEFYYGQLKSVKDAKEKGQKVDYVDRALFKYSQFAQRKIAETEWEEKGLIPDMAERPNFEIDLRNRIIAEGITPYDPKAWDIAEDMLKSVWYMKHTPTKIHEEKPSWREIGEKYGLKWQHVAQYGETAIGGRPKEKPPTAQEEARYQEYLQTNAEMIKEKGYKLDDPKVEAILRGRAEELNEGR